MKKTLSIILAAVMLLSAALVFTGCGEKSEKIIVQTNAYFAPFEYYDGTEIKGVDVDIMAKVSEKTGREVEFNNTEFAAIIDNVAAGEVADCGAAGITVTDERKEKVDFSTPYYTSVQYVIFPEDSNIETVDDEYIVWEAMSGMQIGVQTDTTGHIYLDGELSEGALKDTGAELKNFDNAQLAADAVKANQLDVVIIDQLPAQFIVDKNDGFKCLPLYYSGADGEEDSPVEEQYAICVTKGDTELLEAINSVLAEMMKKDENGETEVDRLLMKHMGLE